MKINNNSSDLSTIRAQIDRVNSQIIKLLAKRYKLSKQVAHYKKLHKLPILDAEREEEMFKSIIKQAQEANLPPDYVVQVFRLIVDHTYQQEDRILQD